MKKVKLSELGEIVGGSTPATKNIENYDGNISWITPKDLANYNKIFIESGERSITEKGFKSSSTKMLPKNSVLFTSRAPIGYIAIAEKELCTNQGFKSIIPNNNVDYIFLYYLLKYNKEYIASFGSGTTFKEVSGTVMKNIEVNIPDTIEEQKKIANILYSIDKKIELNNQINDNLQKFGLEMITQEMKKDATNNLRSIIRFIKGKKPLNISKNKKENYLPYLTIANLNNQENLYASIEKVLIAEKDLLMVMDGASSGDIYYSDYGIVGSTLAKIEILDDSYNQASIYFIIKYFSEYIKSKNTGSAIPHTDKEIVYKLIVPDIYNQKTYENILNTILENNKQNKKLEQLRNTLLPKLMNGEIDLDKIEI